jgi:hypothetical protein
MEISRDNWHDVERRIRTRGVDSVMRSPRRGDGEDFTIVIESDRLHLRYELARELRNEGKLPAALEIKLMLWRHEWMERAARMTIGTRRVYLH